MRFTLPIDEKIITFKESSRAVTFGGSQFFKAKKSVRFIHYM